MMILLFLILYFQHNRKSYIITRCFRFISIAVIKCPYTTVLKGSVVIWLSISDYIPSLQESQDWNFKSS